LIAEEKIRSMEASLLTYLSSCAPDATTSRRISEVGLDALKKQGATARMKWRAKRAGAAAAAVPVAGTAAASGR